MSQHDTQSCRISARGVESFGADAARLFPYWSFTKTVIAFCAVRLATQGRLDLDQPLEGDGHSLRHLLAHTAGLPDYGGLPQYKADVAARRAPWPRDALVQRTLAQGRRFAIGAGWAYSNLGYMLARERVEAAAGHSFERLVADWIARPLGLDSVTYATTQAQFAQCAWPEAAHYHPGWVYHGCLMGTAPDAARLLHALATGDLASPTELAQMCVRTPLGGALPGRPWIECGYGLGLMIGRVQGGARTFGHSGAGPFCVNAVYHWPDTAVTVASFTTGGDEGVPEHAAVALAHV